MVVVEGGGGGRWWRWKVVVIGRWSQWEMVTVEDGGGGKLAVACYSRHAVVDDVTESDANDATGH